MKAVESQQTSFYKILVTLDRFFCVMPNDNNNDDDDGGYFEMQPYKKNVSFRYEKLDLANENDENNDDDIIFNLWENNFRLSEKIHITDDNLKIHYRHEKRCLTFKLKFDNISGTIDKIDEICYFRPTSLIQTGLIYDILAVLEDKLCEKLKISFLDIVNRLGMFRLNCQQHIPLNRVVYLKDLIVAFKRVDKINCKGKIKYCIVSEIVQGDILLQK